MIRVYLPPDANTLLSTMDHCLRSVNYINLVIAGKYDEAIQFLTMSEAIEHCTQGLGIWKWASNDQKPNRMSLWPAGDVPTVEAHRTPPRFCANARRFKIRFINVVDLMRLQPDAEGYTA